MIAFGASDMTKAYIGSTEVTKAYLGSDLVWGGSSPALPYDAEVEWIATDGNAYINTNINASNTIMVEIEMILPTITATTWLFGSRVTSNSGQFGLLYDKSNSRWGWRFGNKTANLSASVDASQYVFDNHTSGAPRQIYITHNNSTLTMTATNNTFSTAYPIYLFVLNVAGDAAVTTIHEGVKLVSAKMYNGTTLLRDYKPVRVGTVGYLYDSVSSTLFGNAGSGSFTLGADV